MRRKRRDMTKLSALSCIMSLAHSVCVASCHFLLPVVIVIVNLTCTVASDVFIYSCDTFFVLPITFIICTL